MNYWRLAVVVSLSAFALSSLVLSAALSLVYPRVGRSIALFAPGNRASALWQLRLAPAAAALTFAFGFVLPTFLVFEPRDTGEPISITLLVLSSIGAVLFMMAAIRGARALSATRALERRWDIAGRRWPGDASFPVRIVPDMFPTVAVVGITAPRLYVAQRIMDECSPGELHAMFAHEAAHVSARDNLKRLAMRVCPDAMWVRAAIERAWACAAEEAADAAATRGSADERLDLAQALVRVARLAPHRPIASPVSAFYLGGTIDSRVRRLLDPTDEPSPGWRWGRVSLLVGLAAAAALITLAPALHQLIEAAVRALP